MRLWKILEKTQQDIRDDMNKGNNDVKLENKRRIRLKYTLAMIQELKNSTEKYEDKI